MFRHSLRLQIVFLQLVAKKQKTQTVAAWKLCGLGFTKKTVFQLLIFTNL